jgi:exopolysaccharide production protein ExoZ
LAIGTYLTRDMTAQTAYLFGFGAVGVHIFFVISGYIMTLVASRGPEFSYYDFVTRRFIRIFPVYWICCALYLAVRAVMHDLPDLTIGQFLGALLLLPDAASRIIGPGWTLTYELYFYLVFAVAMLLGLRSGLIAVSLFFVASIAAGLLTHPVGAGWMIVTSTLLVEFVAGTWIAYLARNRAWPEWLGFAAIVLALLLFAAGLLWGYDRAPSAVLWGVPSAMLVAGAVIVEPRVRQSRAFRAVAHLGDSSYVLYLLHILIIDVAIRLCQLAGIGSGRYVIVAIVVLACIGLSELFHRWVELPLTGRLNRSLHRRVRA